MRRVSALLLAVLAISMFAVTGFVSTGRAEQPEWFCWDVYLWFPEPGPPWPYMMDSSLWWPYNSVYSEDLYVREVVAGDKYFFFRGVKDFVDLDLDGTIDGTYVLDMVVVWQLPLYYVPGEKSIAGRIICHSGTGDFQGMNMYGSAEVQILAWDDPTLPYSPPGPGFNGLVMVQYQEGYIVNSP